MLCETDHPGNKAIVTRRRGPGEILEIVERHGEYRIAVNGEVLGCFRWKGDQLDECKRTLDRLSREER